MNDDILANDRLPVESVRWTDRDGRLHVERSAVTRVQVAPYRGNEIPHWERLGLDPTKIYKGYRPESELNSEATVKSLIGIPIQLDHHLDYPDAPAMGTRVGSTGDNAYYKAPYLYCSLHIQNENAIKRIRDGSMRELSLSYHYDPDFTPGTSPEGEAYDFVMRNIRAQHLALVENGRAGKECCVHDHALKGVAMDDDKTTFEGVKHEPGHEKAEIEAAKQIGALAARIEQLHREKEEPVKDEETPENDKKASAISALKAKGFNDEQIKAIAAALCPAAPAEDEDEEVPDEEGEACDEDEEDGAKPDLFDDEEAEDEDELPDEDPEGEEAEDEDEEDSDSVVADAIKHCGRETDEPEMQKAFADGLKYGRKMKSLEGAQKVAEDTARRVRNLERKLAAADEVRKTLGRVRVTAFDSAGSIYLEALKAEGFPVKGIRKAEARTAYRIVMAQKAKTSGCGAVAQDSAPKADNALSAIFAKVLPQ